VRFCSDGKIPLVQGDDVEVAIGTSSSSARDGEGVGVELLPEMDERGIIGTLVGGSDRRQFLVWEQG
jgi:hypothetical protein